MNVTLRKLIAPILVLIFVIVACGEDKTGIAAGTSKIYEMPFLEFVEKVEAKQVKKVIVIQTQNRMIVEIENEEDVRYEVFYSDDYPLVQLLLKNEVDHYLDVEPPPVNL